MPPGPALTTPGELPRRAGGFELQSELGRGGMGVVYQAQELSSGRIVALKVLLAEHSLSQEAFDRFQREARIAASISDSRCVFVYGAHQVDGAPAIAMELVTGETLEHKLARGDKIPIQTAVRWTIDILDGLEAAAMAGVVHRDVKPSNCFVSADGHVKVGDFGLARSFEADLRLTLTGQFLGSPLYASPEQIKGREVDQRSDLYSCGATLYAMLTGHAPHSGSNIGEVLARILSEQPPRPRSVRPEIPRGLERVVLKAMERDPRKRFQTHADLRAALQSFVLGGTTPAHPLRRTIAYTIDAAVLGLSNVLAMAAFNQLELRPSGEGFRVEPYSAATLLLPLVYFAFFEAWQGATLGKWLAGLRVVADGPRVPRLRIVLRALMFDLPSLVGNALALWILQEDALRFWVSASVLVLTLSLFFTARSANGWRGVHDFMTGTRVVQVRASFASVARSAPPESAPLASYAGMPERIGRYAVSGSVGRSTFGLLLEARDEGLARSVWILELSEGLVSVPETRRMSTRAGRIRWLDKLESEQRRYEVFEAPGGASLLVCAARKTSFTWPRILRLLSSLIEELEHTGSEPVSLHQLWIDRSWNLRVLDAPAGEDPRPARPAPELLLEAARTMLAPGALLPRDMPEHADAVARRLFGLAPPFLSLEEARAALRSLENRPVAVSRGTRAGQIALNTAPAAILALLIGLAVFWMVPRLERLDESNQFAQELDRGLMVESAGAAPRPLADEEREAREILIAAAEHESGGVRFSMTRSEGANRNYDRAVERHPQTSDDEIAWARAHLGRESSAVKGLGEAVRDFITKSPRFVLVLWGLCSSGMALLLRGGMSFRLFELRLRNRRGKPASRWICFLRSLVTWVPLAGLYICASMLARSAGSWLWIPIMLSAAALHAAAIAYAILHPARGLQDIVVRTRIVPR